MRAKRSWPVIAPLLLVFAPAMMGMRACDDSVPIGTTCEAEGANDGPRALTVDECTACGGMLVGDIGDGSTHRPEFRCPDGSPSLGSVAFGIEGAACCPDQRPACQPVDCGPAPGSPSYTCADGSIGGNTGRCRRDLAGVCGWEIRECPDFAWAAGQSAVHAGACDG